MATEVLTLHVARGSPAAKRRAGIPPGADKAASIAPAKRLLPTATHFLVKHDGRAESLLLAVHGLQTRTTTTTKG